MSVSGRWRTAVTIAVTTMAFTLGTAVPVFAQKPRKPRRHFDLDLLGTIAIGSSFGSRNADLIAGDGTVLTVTRTGDARVGVGTGVEVVLGFPASRRLTVEASGSWMRASYSIPVTFDLEGASLVTASEPTSRFAGIGSARWSLARRAKTDVFVRGGVGWLTDVAGGVVIGDGVTGQVGGGLIHYWRDRTAARQSRMGWRVDARVEFQQAGLTEAARTLHVSPVVSGGITIGF